MKSEIDPQDLPALRQLLAAPANLSTLDDIQLSKLRSMLDVTRLQQQYEKENGWKTHLVYLLLFVFLYTVLGASLTLQQSLLTPVSSPLTYAVEATPVLIAFSGFFISVLFVLFARSSARRLNSWEHTLSLLEKYNQMPLSQYVSKLNHSSRNYSQSAMTTALALFICLTWIVMYNYFTFTTSGVIGSVISLFISTMVYVILDIQLLKSDNPAEPPLTFNPPEDN